jgi:hypothetical protein
MYVLHFLSNNVTYEIMRSRYYHCAWSLLGKPLVLPVHQRHQSVHSGIEIHKVIYNDVM